MSGQPVTPRRAKDIADWADEADVVVVGFGAAGASAAFEAAGLVPGTMVAGEAKETPVPFPGQT